MPTQKLYCYVDETGQDTRGRLFIVSVVIPKHDRVALIAQLEAIEHSTGKERRKWTHTRPSTRLAYMQQVLGTPTLRGALHYAMHPHTTDYLGRTIRTVAQAVTLAATAPVYDATVFVDGLPKSRTRSFGAELRHLGVRVRKVRGVRREESDALMRLADASCAFVRAAIDQPVQPPFAALFAQAKQAGVLVEV